MAAHAQQGWSLLCNGVLLFEDTGELLPNGHVIHPHRAPVLTFATAVPRPLVDDFAEFRWGGESTWS